MCDNKQIDSFVDEEKQQSAEKDCCLQKSCGYVVSYRQRNELTVCWLDSDYCMNDIQLKRQKHFKL